MNITVSIDADIAAAQAAYPDLDTFGFGNTGGAPFNQAEVATAIAFLQRCRKSKHGVSSYFLKHIIEDWGRHVGRAPYICNGAAIVAAHASGFNIKRGSECNYAPANAVIGINRADIDKISKEVRVQQLMRCANA